MLDILVNVYLMLYPIAPGFFKIFGFDSGVILTFVFCFLFVLFRVKTPIRIKKTNISFVSRYLFFLMIPLIFHGEITRLIRVLFEYGIAVLIMLYNFDSKKKIDKAINTLIVVATVMCFFGIYEFFFGNNLFSFLFNGSALDLSPDLQMRGRFARSETTFGHAITYSIYMSFIGLLASYRCFVKKQRKYLLPYIFIVLNIILSISRGPILFFLVSQVILLYFSGLKTLVKTIGKAAIIVLLSFMLLSWILPSFFEGIRGILIMVLAVFSENAAQQVGYITNANPFTYRLELLKVIPHYFKGYLLFGHGGSERVMFSMFGLNYYSIDNAYLAWIMKYGLVGLMGHLIPLYIIIIRTMSQRKKHNEYAPFIAISVDYLLNLFSVAQMGEYRVWILLFSLIISCINLTKKAYAVNEES